MTLAESDEDGAAACSDICDCEGGGRGRRQREIAVEGSFQMVTAVRTCRSQPSSLHHYPPPVDVSASHTSISAHFSSVLCSSGQLVKASLTLWPPASD